MHLSREMAKEPGEHIFAAELLFSITIKAIGNESKPATSKMKKKETGIYNTR